MMIDFKDIVKLRKEAKQKAEEEKSRRKNYQSDYEQIEWMGLITDEERVFRCLGRPFEIRENGYDVKYIFHSKIVDDSNKSELYTIWKCDDNDKITPTLDKSWILYRLMNDVLSVKWDNPPKGAFDEKGNPKKGTRIFIHEGTKSYEWVKNNTKSESNSPYPSNFYPSKKILINVIDRHDGWCKENKHSKILSSKVSISEKENNIVYYPDYGIPFTVYESILNNIVEFRGSWLDLDIIIKKRTTDNGGYIIRDIREDKIGDNIKEIGIDGPISDIEKEYTLYDFDKLFPVTSYHKLMRRLERKFKTVDSEIGTYYFQELQELVRLESEEFEKNRKEQEKTVHPTGQSESPIRKPKEEKIEREENHHDHDDFESKLREQFPYFKDLSEEEQGEILKSGLKIENGNIIYKENTNLLPCNCEKKINFPNTVFKCAKCGDNLD